MFHFHKIFCLDQYLLDLAFQKQVHVNVYTYLCTSMYLVIVLKAKTLKDKLIKS